jgi:Restriction Enzyme Adenine Methylase Associated
MNRACVGDRLTWNRPRLGVTYGATVGEGGQIELADGRRFASPSVAAIKAAGVVSSDGWYVWRVDRLDGRLLNERRLELSRQITAEDRPDGSAGDNARSVDQNVDLGLPLPGSDG